MNKVDLLFVFPPAGNHEHPHLGLPLLLGYLREHNIKNCLIKDYNAPFMEQLLKELMVQRPELFGEKIQDYGKNYNDLKYIMKGKDDQSHLKSGLAMNIISNYLRVLGTTIHERSLDPVSFFTIINALNDPNYNDSVTKYLDKAVIPELVKMTPNILGFSVVFPSQIFYTFYICRAIRKQIKSTKIMLGGPQVSLFYKAIISKPECITLFDVLVRAQGEKAVYELARLWLYRRGSLSTISNIIYKNENNKVIENPLDKSVPMKDVALPDFTDYDLTQYAFPKLPYMLSRGCYWGKCKFCGYRGNGKYISASIQKVIYELEELKERYDIRIFHFMDDAISPGYLKQLAEELINKNIDITYAAYLRAENGFTADLCHLLYRSGLRSVLFGFESANKRILQKMSKGTNLNETTSILRNFKNSGIMNYLSCIIGFPTETRSEAMETIEFLKNNKDLYYKAYITPFRLMSDMIENPDDYDIYDLDIENPIRHDINGYVSLEIPFRSRRGMTHFEYMDMVYRLDE